MKTRSSTSSAVRTNQQTTPTSTGVSKPRRVSGVKGVKSEITMTINRPAEELFAFWRNFENLPKIMAHIESVKCMDPTRSRWRARRSKDDAESLLEWDSEVINERPDEMIAWRTAEGSEVQHAGSIWFQAAPGGSETEVKLEVTYETNGFVDFIAKLARRSPTQQMREELRHFKQLMETGEIATTAGQSASRTNDVVAKYQESK